MTPSSMTQSSNVHSALFAGRLPQPLHIFRKDVVHLWPETLTVVALFVAFAWSAPSGWQHSAYAGAIQILAGLLHLLMPLSWLVLISRLVHDEPLTGDRQFWTSRPYHWANLLAAKLIYLVVFLYLPFLLMQIYLLKRAGLYPTTVVPELLHNLLLLTVIIIVPLTAIAAVTGTFARMLLSVLGGIIYVVVFTVGLGFRLIFRMPAPHLNEILVTIFVVLPLAALIYQYATRKTLVARVMLLATPLLAALVLLLLPVGALVRASYPVMASSDNPPKFGDLPEALRPKVSPDGKVIANNGVVGITLPFTVQGLDKDTNYTVSGIQPAIDTPGFHWVGSYNVAGAQINAESPVALLTFPIPEDVFNKVHSTPADIHLSLAADHLKVQPAATWKATLTPFSVLGHGICTYTDDAANPVCRFPFKTPDYDFMTAPVVAGSCAQPQGPTQRGGSSFGQHSGGTLDFDPVVTVPMNFSSGSQQGPPPLLCPGAEISFLEARSQGKVRLEVDQKKLVLDPYANRLDPRRNLRREPATELPPAQ